MAVVWGKVAGGGRVGEEMVLDRGDVLGRAGEEQPTLGWVEGAMLSRKKTIRLAAEG